VIIGRPRVRAWPRARERARERKGMTGGAKVSARERENARAGAWARMGRVAGPRRSGRERAGRPFGWAEPEGERRVDPRGKFCFPFSKM
jgi:hypothetical protein